MSNRIFNCDFTVPAKVSPLIDHAAFPGDQQSLILRQSFWIEQKSFARTPLDTPHPDRPGFYLVEETEPRHIGGGILEWERVWANIPASREVGESYAFTVPGIETLGEFAALGVSSATSGGGVTTITTALAHGFAPDDGVIIRYFVTDQAGRQHLRQLFRLALVGTTGSTLKVEQVIDIGSIYWAGATVFPPPGRQPFTVVVPSVIQFDYFLPGVSTGISSPKDIPIFQAFEIIGSDGNRTESLSDTSSPTVGEYREMVANQDQIVAEASMSRRWMGNIHERATRYVTAT
jgi:hypothetical protein